MPVAHAEGKFVTRSPEVFRELEAHGQLVLRYLGKEQPNPQSPIPNPQSPIPSPIPYPDNPNGSMGDVAGVCDATGRVLGLMPHPERHIDATQHPRWTRSRTPSAASPLQPGDGFRIFRNAVEYFA